MVVMMVLMMRHRLEHSTIRQLTPAILPLSVFAKTRLMIFLEMVLLMKPGIEGSPRQLQIDIVVTLMLMNLGYFLRVRLLLARHVAWTRECPRKDRFQSKFPETRVVVVVVVVATMPILLRGRWIYMCRDTQILRISLFYFKRLLAVTMVVFVAIASVYEFGLRTS